MKLEHLDLEWNRSLLCYLFVLDMQHSFSSEMTDMTEEALKAASY